MFTALSKAQAQIKSAVKGSKNPHFNSDYADLAAVWQACREPLAEHGLAVMQLPTSEGAVVSVSTVLTHSSGQFIMSRLSMKARDAGPQAVGSAITYGRRYGLSSMVGIAPADDDDGNLAERKPTKDEKEEQRERVAQQRIAKIKARSPLKKSLPPATQEPAVIQQAQAKMTGVVESIEVLGKVKARMVKQLGKALGESEYDRVMKKYGAVKRNDFFVEDGGGAPKARQAVRDMLLIVEASKDEAEMRRETAEADAPEVSK